MALRKSSQKSLRGRVAQGPSKTTQASAGIIAFANDACDLASGQVEIVLVIQGLLGIVDQDIERDGEGGRRALGMRVKEFAVVHDFSNGQAGVFEKANLHFLAKLQIAAIGHAFVDVGLFPAQWDPKLGIHVT